MLFPLIYCFQTSLQSMKRQLSLTLILLTLACLIAGTNNARPKQKGLVPGFAGALKSNSIEEIVAYSDLNRDGRIDIITKSANLQMGEQQLNLYIWNAKLKEFQQWGSLPTNYINLQTVLVSSFKVLSAFHMVLFFNPTDASPYIQMIPYSCSNYQCQFGNQFVVPEIKSGIDASPPSLIGINGKIGLLYHAKGIANVLQFDLNETLTFKTTLLSELVENASSITNILHSYNGDYDGDCLTDLIILKTDPSDSANSILQFIRGSENNQYKLVQSKTITQFVQHFTLQDINFDGKNDLILLLKSSKLQIHYHRYGTDTKLCNGLPINELPYDFQTSEQQARLIQRVEFSSALYPKSLLLFGDYNNDGFGDISITFMDKDNNFPQSALLENQVCLGATCGTYNPRLIQQSSTLNIRTFSIKPILGSSQVSSKLSFIDLFDDGNLDFMFQVQVADPTGIKYTTIQTVFNNVDYDAFFLTITIYSSLSNGDILTHTEYIGGVASFYVTLLSGVLQPRTGNQLSQAGNALQLPYIHQGLGRTNNYLEDLTVTVPRNPFSQFKWSPIIPNSDINIAPPPQNQPGSLWVLQVMIEPTQKMAFVLLLVIVSLGILGVVILRLSRKQKEQDKQTQQSFYTLLR